MLLTAQDLKVTIAEKRICDSLTIEIDDGERWALLGRNGIGKSTLLQTLAGLRPSQMGKIRLQGDALETLTPVQIAQRRGLLFQQQEDPFPSTVLETAMTGRHPYLRPWQWESLQDHAKALEALRAVQLEPLAQRLTATLSGGERQRLAIATLLTQEPSLLLLDEPTNHLDIHQQIAILELLRQWSTQGDRALLMILHDINLALRYCTHAILLLGDGEVVMGRCDEVMTAEYLERLYLHPLLMIAGEWGVVYLPR